MKSSLESKSNGQKTFSRSEELPSSGLLPEPSDFLKIRNGFRDFLAIGTVPLLLASFVLGAFGAVVVNENSGWPCSP